METWKDYRGLGLELTYHFFFLLLAKENYVAKFFKIEKYVLTTVGRGLQNYIEKGVDTLRCEESGLAI